MGNPRTCVGCRRRDDRSRLLRVVVEDPSATAPRVVPDPGARLGGRGAWIHPTPQCVEQAVRRRAFARALRVAGSVTNTDVTASVEQMTDDAHPETSQHGSGKRLMDQR